MGILVSKKKSKDNSNIKTKQNQEQTTDKPGCQLLGVAKFEGKGVVEGSNLGQKGIRKTSLDSNMNIENKIMENPPESTAAAASNVASQGTCNLNENPASAGSNREGEQALCGECDGVENMSSKNETQFGNGGVQSSVTSTDVSEMLPKQHTCSDTIFSDTKTAIGSNDDNETLAEGKMEEVPGQKMNGIAQVSNADNADQEHSSVTITTSESGAVQAKYYASKQPGEMSKEDIALSCSANNNERTNEEDKSCSSGKGTNGDSKQNVPDNKLAMSIIADTEHEPELAKQNRNEQTANDGQELKDKNNKKTPEISKTAEREQEDSAHQLSENLLFYRNETYSKPFPGEKIEEMLKWKGDYLRLERTHSYIQWLFPIPDSRGMNYSAQPLQEHEAKTISEDETLRARVLEAYKMMLDFFGMELVNDKTGEVRRGDNWEERYEHLDRSIHNRFRITRIIKALGELGFEKLQGPWLEFIIQEAALHQKLPSLNSSCMDHWIGAIKDASTQGKLYVLLADLNGQLQAVQHNGNQQKREGEKHAGNNNVVSNGDNGTASQTAGNDNVDEKNENSKEVNTAERKIKEADSSTSTIDENVEEAQYKKGNTEKVTNEETGTSDAELITSGKQTKHENLLKYSEENNADIETTHETNETKEGECGNMQLHEDSRNVSADDKKDEMCQKNSDQDADEHEYGKDVEIVDSQNVIGSQNTEAAEVNNGQAVTNGTCEQNSELSTANKNGNEDKNNIEVGDNTPKETADEKTIGCETTIW